MTARRLKSAAMAAVMALGLAAAGCGREPATDAAKLPAAPQAGRLSIEMSTVPDLKPVPAVLTTRDMADARARIPGVLTRLSVKEGDSVRKGQVIGLVQDDRIGLQTSAYDAQVSAAAAQAANAQADLTRTRELVSHGVYAQARLDQAEAQAKAAEGVLASARAQRDASSALAGQGAILAPSSGKVLSAGTPAGSVVMAGQSVAQITAGPPVVRLTLPEADARRIKVGDPVALDPADLGGAAVAGVVSQIYPAVEQGQATVDVTAAGLPENLVGQRVRAGVTVGLRQAILIPRSYVTTRFGVDYATLVTAQGGASDMPVQVTAGPSPGKVEVLSGLRPGDVIVPPGAVR